MRYSGSYRVVCRGVRPTAGTTGAMLATDAMLAYDDEGDMKVLSEDEVDLIRVAVVDDQRLFTKGLSAASAT